MVRHSVAYTRFFSMEKESQSKFLRERFVKGKYINTILPFNVLLGVDIRFFLEKFS